MEVEHVADALVDHGEGGPEEAVRSAEEEAAAASSESSKGC